MLTKKQDTKSPAMSEADEFLYIVTHDLKAFARALKLIPQWICDDLVDHGVKLPADVVGHVDMLCDYAARLDGMLDGLTDLSRVGRASDKPEQLDLGTLIRQIWDELETSGAFSLNCELDACDIFGPRNDVSRLISAILDNAIRHHDKDVGCVRVTSMIVAGRIEIEITDDGPGIPPEFQERVFKPLHTLQPKSGTGRPGIGLSVAQKVVTGLGGQIRITAPDGTCGCRVVFDLPAHMARPH